MADTSDTPDLSGGHMGQAPYQPAEAESAEQKQPAIDVEALAEKVYRLMLAEIRLDRARGQASSDGV